MAVPHLLYLQQALAMPIMMYMYDRPAEQIQSEHSFTASSLLTDLVAVVDSGCGNTAAADCDDFVVPAARPFSTDSDRYKGTADL